MSEPVDWANASAPRSPRFDDTYFSVEDGLAESRAVFLEGCALADAFAKRRHFTIAELGFGTGLNILAALELWRRTRSCHETRLHLFSIEAFPMARDDARRALAHWPELKDLAATLLAAWPDGRKGPRRIEWPALGATLDLVVAEAGEALAGWTGAADAWFLDGFAPSRNPDMWRDEVLALIADRSRPGARVASFTVAGAVRRGLEAQGFTVERKAGFGRKKQRLEARWPGSAPSDPPPSRAAILGAGIAGASLRRAFDRLGIQTEVFDARGPGGGASGNLAALVTPRLDAGLGPVARLHAEAFARAAELYSTDVPDALIARGALQLEVTARDASRFERIVAWDRFDKGALDWLEPAAVADALGEPILSGALAYRDALVVEPKKILDHWLVGGVQTKAVDRLEQSQEGTWRLVDQTGAKIADAEIVVIAAGAQSDVFMSIAVRAVRGQVSSAEVPFAGMAAAWGGYAIPTRSGILFGATHDRGDTATDIRCEDHARNLAALAERRPTLAGRLKDVVLEGRAGVRATTPDHLPLAGPLSKTKNLFVLTALGGRGFTLAPLLAEHIAAQALDLGGPLTGALAKSVAPSRLG